VPSILLPGDYTGKILLVSVSGGIIREKICLGSGDLNHRDIMRNTELEIQEQGLCSTKVREIRGACLTTGANGLIHIWGGSDDFGACDKRLTAAMVKSVYPDTRITIGD
jgi:hypothetical protein